MADPTPNERRLTAHATTHGWRVHSRDELQTTIELRKRRRPALTVAFGHNGHVLWTRGAVINSRPRPLSGTQALLDYLST